MHLYDNGNKLTDEIWSSQLLGMVRNWQNTNICILVRLWNCVQFVIKSFLIHEIRVSSWLHHFSVLENHDAVGVLDCGETVSDDDACPALLSSFQSFLYDLEEQGNNDHDTWFISYDLADQFTELVNYCDCESDYQTTFIENGFLCVRRSLLCHFLGGILGSPGNTVGNSMVETKLSKQINYDYDWRIYSRSVRINIPENVVMQKYSQAQRTFTKW